MGNITQLLNCQATRAGIEQVLSNALSQSRNPQVIPAGKQDRPVIEDRGDGIFSRTPLDRLTGHADPNHAGLMTLSELGAWPHPRVAQASEYKPEVQWGKLDREWGGRDVPESAKRRAD